MDRSMDDAVATMLSILEDGISQQAARDALHACHGNVERAIIRVLESRDRRAAPVEPWPPREVIEIGSDSAKRRRIEPPRTSLPSRIEPPRVSPATGKELAIAFLAAGKRVDKDACRRYLSCEMNSESTPGSSWLSAHPEWTQFDYDSLSWQVERDPPCLTLRGLNEEMESCCSGEMHADFDWSSSDLTKGVRVAGENISVDCALLQKLFSDLLSKVRYQPATVECSFRALTHNDAIAQCRQINFVPPDLQGRLPKRPFDLLDNTNDSEAKQPSGFTQHKLRPEQLRSLSWMLAREGYHASAPGIDEECEPEPFLVEWRRFWTPGYDSSEDDFAKLPDQCVVGAQVVLSRPDAAIRRLLPRELDVELVLRDHVRLGYCGGDYTVDSLNVDPRAVGTVKAERMGFAVVSFSNKWGPDVEAVVSKSDLELAVLDQLCVGAFVKIRPDVCVPKFGWGGVQHGVVGIIKQFGEGHLYGHNTCVWVKFPVHENWKGICGELELCSNKPKYSNGSQPPITLDLRIRASYPVRGGILGDKIGYGKTATTIALINHSIDRPLPPMPEQDRQSFIPAKGTVVIVPSNLLDQWLGEFSKFLWDGRPMKKGLKNGWSHKTCPLKIFAMTNVTPLTTCKAKDLVEADVVLCSYRLLFSPIYQDRRVEIAGLGNGEKTLRDLVTSTKRFLQGESKMPSGRSSRKSEQEERREADNWQDLVFPVLEMFYWRRVVFDEFHELESFESAQQNSLQHMRCHYRWGLTGTPPVNCNAGVIFMSSLFRMDLPGFLPETEIPMTFPGCPQLNKWESDKLLSEIAGRFLDHTVRQNTAELPHIGLEEHVIFVQPTSTERALYLGQAHDAPDMSRDDAFASEENRRSLERLLKLCSHFQAVGDKITDAKSECTRIGDQKERRFAKARNQLQRCSRVIRLLKAKLLAETTPKTALQVKEKKISKGLSKLEHAKEQLASEGSNGAEVKELLHAFEKEADAEDLETCCKNLGVHKPNDQELVGKLMMTSSSDRGSGELWWDFIKAPMSSDLVLQFLSGQAAEQTQNLAEVIQARASYFFFNRTVEALVADDSPSNRACVVCLEEGFPLAQLSITPCAHAFCMTCLTSTVEKFKCCSICRKPLTVKDIRPLDQEIKAPETSSSSSSSECASRDITAAAAKHGTKLAAVVKKLQELRAEDATAKVILFVQFDDLKRKVAGALEDFGIPARQLHGSVAQRSSITNDWQNNPNSEAFVLLLSLAQSASGANLTAANHVVFLHPMLAPSAEIAIGYELQAIGRARRHGQKRSTVHVHRFVATNTIEQSITERHQAALWERETVRRDKEIAAEALDSKV